MADDNRSPVDVIWDVIHYIDKATAKDDLDNIEAPALRNIIQTAYDKLTTAVLPWWEK